MHISESISLNSSQNEKCLRQNLQRKSEHILFSMKFFEDNALNEIMIKTMV